MAPANVVGFDEALASVSAHAESLGAATTEDLPLLECRGRVLAEAIVADGDQLPFDRSTRDGFAVHAEQLLPDRSLRVVGQVRAGERWLGASVEAGSAIEIMTGAPLPEGADAVVMVEHMERAGDAIRLSADRTLRAGENVVPQGSEARAGSTVLGAGTVLEAAEIALAAACGRPSLKVFRRPSVAIVATGDELVELDK